MAVGGMTVLVGGIAVRVGGTAVLVGGTSVGVAVEAGAQLVSRLNKMTNRVNSLIFFMIFLFLLVTTQVARRVSSFDYFYGLTGGCHEGKVAYEPSAV